MEGWRDGGMEGRREEEKGREEREGERKLMNVEISLKLID